MVGLISPKPSNPVTHFATRNMWSSPFDNQQFRLAVKRVSPDEGYVQLFTYMHKNRQLPTANTFYQVYTLSGLTQSYWNIIDDSLKRNPVDTWLNLADLCSKRGLHVDLYDDKGKIYPRNTAWVMQTYDGLNLLALEKSRTLPLLVKDNFYLRCYTPDWDMYHAETKTGNVQAAFNYTMVDGVAATDLPGLTTTYQQWSVLPGLTSVYVNGLRWSRLPYSTELTTGMIVELVYDPTVMKTLTYQIKNLPDFYSTIDKKRKLILHPAKDNTDLGFYSFDDCDFYLVSPNGVGVYIALNDISVVRQLTHRDYSLSSDALNQYLNTLTGVADITNCSVLVIYRNSKLRYNLQYEESRIRYLYALSDANILGAMTAANSTLPEWNAATLEASMTMQVDRASWTDITRDLVYKALGYNGSTYAFGNTPVKVTSPTVINPYDIPIIYQSKSTVVEYDGNGLLIGFYPLTNAATYVPQNAACEYIEFFVGTPSATWNKVDGVAPVNVPANVDFRIYKCGYSIDTKLPDEKWVDITGTDQYTVVNGVITFTFDTVNNIARVIFNDQLLAKTITLDNIDGSMFFNFTDETVFNNDAKFAPANITLFLNGHSLIENVDYRLNYPECYIVNRKFVLDDKNSITMILDGPSPQFGSGFNQSELGYVVDGVLGYNGLFNIRNGRRVRVVCNGRLFTLDEFGSSEKFDLLDPTNPYNGYPYSVKHIYQALPGIVTEGNYVDFAAGRDLDQRVSDYLGKYITKQDPGVTNIEDKYQLFSTFLSLVIGALSLGVIDLPDPPTNGRYDKQTLQDLTQAYQWSFAYDPCKLNFDSRYFSIAPYPTPSLKTVNTKTLLFLNQLNETYLGSLINVNGYFEVNNNV